MNLEYNFEREDLKKILFKKRIFSTVVILLLGTALYFYLSSTGFKSEFFDNTKLLIGYIIYFVILTIVVLLFNMLYVYLKLKGNDKRTNRAYGKYIIKLDDKKIESSFNDQKISYKWADISKLKIRKNYFFIRTKSDYIGLTFRKNMLKDDYATLLEYVKKKVTI